jgi:MFS family permease
MIIYSYRKIRAYRARKATEAAQASTADKTAPAPETNTDKSVTPLAPAKPASCSHCIEEKKRARSYRWKILLCLTPAFFVSSLDLTIIASALPTIALHFDKFNQLNWIVTAFTLTDTAFIPVWGQLADIFGRHSTLQCAVIILAIGSVLCAAAQDWAMLLFGRALQGIATAGTSNVILIILADKVSLREQAVNTSIFQLLNGVGYAVGPVVGGYLTNASWRYCFVLCAAISVCGMLTILLLRKDLKTGKFSLSRPAPGMTRLRTLTNGLSTLDYGGITLFILGVGLIILGTAWGGSTYRWSSAAVLCSLIIGAVLFIAFIVYEFLLESKSFTDLKRILPSNTIPMIPASILKAKDVSLVCLITASTGAAVYSVFYFIGIYFTLVEAYSASHSGTQLLYYIPGIGVGVYSAIFVCNVYPRQTFPPLAIGTVIETVGIAVLAYAVKTRNATLVNVMMGVSGAGTGLRFMPSNLHLAGMFRDQIAAVYSVLRFAMPFGGTLALTIMGSVFQNQMSDYFGSGAVRSGTNVTSSGGINLQNSASLDAINQLSPDQQTKIRHQGATATMWAFVSILPIMVISMLASFALGNVWISKKLCAEKEEAGAMKMKMKREETNDGVCQRHANGIHAAEEEQRNEVEYLSEVYLIAAATGKVKSLKRKGALENAAAVAGVVGEDHAQKESTQP